MAIGVPVHHQNPSFGQHFGGLGRTDSTSNSSTSQSFQGHMRPSSVGSPATPSTSASQSMQPINQPWLPSGPTGKPPLPFPHYRQQLNPPSLQQRSHMSQQQHFSNPHQLLHSSSNLFLLINRRSILGDKFCYHGLYMCLTSNRLRGYKGPGNQKPSSLMASQSSAVQPGTQSRLTNVDTDVSCNNILSKRSIHELVNQRRGMEEANDNLCIAKLFNLKGQKKNKKTKKAKKEGKTVAMDSAVDANNNGGGVSTSSSGVRISLFDLSIENFFRDMDSILKGHNSTLFL